jgi:hypothetical protein
MAGSSSDSTLNKMGDLSVKDKGAQRPSLPSFAGGGPNGARCLAEKSDPLTWVFDSEHIIGNGSFGVVYQAVVKNSNPPRVRPRPPETVEPSPASGQSRQCAQPARFLGCCCARGTAGSGD